MSNKILSSLYLTPISCYSKLYLIKTVEYLIIVFLQRLTWPVRTSTIDLALLCERWFKQILSILIRIFSTTSSISCYLWNAHMNHSENEHLFLLLTMFKTSKLSSKRLFQWKFRPNILFVIKLYVTFESIAHTLLIIKFVIFIYNKYLRNKWI